MLYAIDTETRPMLAEAWGGPLCVFLFAQVRLLLSHLELLLSERVSFYKESFHAERMRQ